MCMRRSSSNRSVALIAIGRKTASRRGRFSVGCGAQGICGLGRSSTPTPQANKADAKNYESRWFGYRCHGGVSTLQIVARLKSGNDVVLVKKAVKVPIAIVPTSGLAAPVLVVLRHLNDVELVEVVVKIGGAWLK